MDKRRVQQAEQLAEKIKERYPVLRFRVQRGLELFRQGAVKPNGDGTYRVRSQSHRTTWYTVTCGFGRGWSCTCRDARKPYGAPKINGYRRCKHMIAAWLWRVTDEGEPPTKPLKHPNPNKAKPTAQTKHQDYSTNRLSMPGVLPVLLIL